MKQHPFQARRSQTVWVIVALAAIIVAATLWSPGVSRAQGGSGCSDGAAVADPSNNAGLVSDCQTLLEAKDTLDEDGVLNWSADLPIGEWDGVTTGGSPTRITFLNVAALDLSGTIPAALGNLAGLDTLYLQINRLRGGIPVELGNLSNLQVLHLTSNRLTGQIPPELGNLTSLTWLDIMFNRLTGEIPEELGQLSGLERLRLNGNSLTGAIPSRLGDLAQLHTLRLEHNELSGSIPGTLGDLSALEMLILSYNQLTGDLPSELGRLSALIRLDINDNMLTGCIPAELAKNTALYIYSDGLRSCATAPPARVNKSSITFTPIHVSGSGDSVTIAWTDPEIGGTEVDGYRIRYQAGSPFPTWTEWITIDDAAGLSYSDVDGEHPTFTFSDYIGYYRYRFQIAAFNSVGQGKWSGSKELAPSRELPDCVLAAYRHEPDASVFLDDCEPPRITGYHISSEPLEGDTYQPGEILEITYAFNEAVTLYPGPEPHVTFAAPGNRHPRAIYDAERSREAGPDRMVFTWLVPDGIDGGIWVGPNSPGHQFSIGDFDGNALAPREQGYGRQATIGRKDGNPVMRWGGFSNRPINGSYYQPGEDIEVTTRWDRPVRVDADNPAWVHIVITDKVSGTPRADYNQKLSEAAGMDELVFTYTVQPGDSDDDGIWIGASNNSDYRSLKNSAGITDYSGRSPSNWWPTDQRGHDVDDSPPPHITDIYITSKPVSGDRYQPGEEMEIQTVASKPVRVARGLGPHLVAEVGRGHGQFEYDAEATLNLTPNRMAFTWTVYDGSEDDDGITLDLSIFHNANATFDYSGNAISTLLPVPNFGDNARKVGDAGAPSIIDVDFSSRPMLGGQYQPGEVVEITLTADEPVLVAGDNLPYVQLRVADRYPRATYSAARTAAKSKANQLVFTWTVQDGFQDNDEFLIAPDYFRNTVGVTDWSDNAIDATLPGYWGNDTRHKVGDLGPPLITNIAVTSTPASGDTYGAGETIEIALTATESIDVSNNSQPRLVIEVGQNYPSARYDAARSRNAGANKLVFTLDLQDYFEDENGILLGPTSLRDARGVLDGSGNRVNANLQKYWFLGDAKVRRAPTYDYDNDNDGLIGVSSLAQLNAIRWDLDGNGSADEGSNDADYSAAYPSPTAGVGCPSAGCSGYELTVALDFDTNGNGSTDAGDDYWNDGTGWVPIGTYPNGFTATFDGSHHTISNLFINRRSTNHLGLFGYVDTDSTIRNVGLVAVDVSGHSGSYVGGLVGRNHQGNITNSFVAGQVGGFERIGGLVGRNFGGTIFRSYSVVTVTGSNAVGGLVGHNWLGTIGASYSGGDVSGAIYIGGLVGWHDNDDIIASYVTGNVIGTDHHVGGLVGYFDGGTLLDSYATGSVSGGADNVGGLAGVSNGTITRSYWDTDATGQSTSDGGSGYFTNQLQAPTDYVGIYVGWNVDYDNADEDDDTSTGVDRPWDFGSSEQYPALRVDFNGDGAMTWPEFGNQRP